MQDENVGVLIQERPDPPEVYRGYLEECWKRFKTAFNHYFPKSQKGNSEKMEIISKFCGNSVDNVRRWLGSDFVPRGEVMFRLMCFLDCQGYRVIELEKLKKHYRSYLELACYKVVSFKELAERAGYNNSDYILRIFRLRLRFSKSAEEVLWNLLQDKKTELEERKKRVVRMFPNDGTLVTPRRAGRSRRRPKFLPNLEVVAEVSESVTTHGNKLVAHAAEVMIEVIDGCAREDLPVESIRRLLAKLNDTFTHLIAERQEGGGRGQEG